MSPAATAVGLLAALCLAAGLALVALAVRVERHRRRAPALPAAAGNAGAGHPAEGGGAVAVLLPVRDEEENLVACLRTLLHQTAAPRIVVIDDHSTDATRALAAGRAEAEPRLEVISADPLPPAWGGKVHALHCGHRHLRSGGRRPPTWVLSTDADTRHHPQLLERALAAARAWDLDAVSVAGFQEVRGLAENLLTPPVFALLDAELGDWRPVARGEGPPVANGQFLLLREAVLERAGGFAAIRGVAIDDVGLVRAMRTAGGRTGFVRAPDLLRVRMYEGLGRVYRGWRRNLGGLFGERPGRTAAVLAALTGPALLLVTALAAGAALPDRTLATAALAGAGILWTCGAAASAALRRGSGHRAAWGLLYPLDALFLAATLALGVLDWRRGALLAWKGRKVRAR